MVRYFIIVLFIIDTVLVQIESDLVSSGFLIALALGLDSVLPLVRVCLGLDSASPLAWICVGLDLASPSVRIHLGLE